MEEPLVVDDVNAGLHEAIVGVDQVGCAPRFIEWEHDVAPCVQFPGGETQGVHKGAEHKPTWDALGPQDREIGVGLFIAVAGAIGQACRT